MADCNEICEALSWYDYESSNASSQEELVVFLIVSIILMFYLSVTIYGLWTSLSLTQ